MTAASVVTASDARLVRQPARWGWNWSSEPDYFGNEDPATVAHRLVRDDRVAGVGELDTGSVGVNGIPTSGWAMNQLKGDMAL